MSHIDWTLGMEKAVPGIMDNNETGMYIPRLVHQFQGQTGLGVFVKDELRVMGDPSRLNVTQIRDNRAARRLDH
jgi:hypothetical protein